MYSVELLDQELLVYTELSTGKTGKEQHFRKWEFGDQNINQSNMKKNIV
jgi:hypothetical protein